MANPEQKYTVHMQSVTSSSVTISAEGPEEAAEAVFDSEDFPEPICVGCSGWGQAWSRDDDGEWEVVEIANEKGEIVWPVRNDV